MIPLESEAKALAVITGHTPAMCLLALQESGGKVIAAKRLLRNPDFIDAHPEAKFGDSKWGGLAEEYDSIQQQIKAAERQSRALAGSTMVGLVFGKLKWNDAWEGVVKSPLRAKTPITIETPDNGSVTTPPSDAQRKPFEQFTNIVDELWPQIEQANFNYYERIRPNYEAEDFKPPVIKTPAAMRRHLKHGNLLLPIQRKAVGRIILQWECSWDGEHGHAVYLENGKIKDIGQQGVGF